MNYLAENAVAIWMAGAVLATLAGVVYWQTRAGLALLAMLAVVLGTALLLGVEYAIETPREAVERTIHELTDAIEANDLSAVLRHIAPNAAQVRADAESLMPLVTVNKANLIGTPAIELALASQPPRATMKCQGFIEVTIRKNGIHGGHLDRLTIELVAVDGRWLVDSYTPAKDFRKAIAGARGN